jgi:predicted component of type VI protein secretion system
LEEEPAGGLEVKGRNLVTRSVRRTGRLSRVSSPSIQRDPAAVQIFLFRDERFLGSQLFDVAQPIVLGRSRRAHLRLDGDTVSRLHCQIIYENGEVLIEDLGSANGTYLNRVRVVGHLIVEPTDAIHIGAYSIRTRPLHASSSLQATDFTNTEAITRIEAVLTAGGEGESEEAVVDLSRGVDRRLYEDAIRRATGGTTTDGLGAPSASEPAHDTIPAEREFSSSKKTDPSEQILAAPKNAISDHPVRLRASDGGPNPSDRPPLRAVPTKTPSETVRIDPDVEARLRDLDELIAALDAKQKPREVSRRNLRAIEGLLGKNPADHEPAGSSSSSRFEREMLEGLKAMSTQEFARDLGSKIAVQGRVVKPKQIAPPSSAIPPPLPTQNPVVPPPLPRLATIPRAPMSEGSPRADTADTAKSTNDSKPTEEESGPFEDVWTKSSMVAPGYDGDDDGGAEKPTLPDSVKARAPRTTIDPPAVPPPPLPSRVVNREAIDLKRSPRHPDRQPTRPNAFEGIEISARSRGKLVDVSLLRKEGDQYVLGHATPQGKIAPASAHLGLRMLRVNPDRTVDLVFPRDVAGHLVRGRETVMFNELTEGRKYSCLRLEMLDVATIILGEGQHAISYHIRFLTKGTRPSRPAARAQ